MAFPEHLARTAATVEAALAAILDEMEGAVPDRLLSAMRHGLLDGGKRLRPFLVIASARLFGIAQDKALLTACALECVHSYSLVHDDLPAMDDDTLRRGKPTVHAAFGEAAAILAGDALLTLAFEILTDPRTHDDAAVRAALALDLARAAGARGMAGGQMLDMDAQGSPPERGAVTRLQAMKTGALIRHACEAGAILGGANDGQRAALAAYGTALGAAFQLSDDLLDLAATSAEAGKATGKDAGAGKATLVALLGEAGARAELARLAAQAEESLGPFGADAAMLREAASFVTTRRS